MFNAHGGGLIKNPTLNVTDSTIINNFSQLTSDSPPTPKRVWFQVPVAIKSFCGRKEFLDKLHSLLLPENQNHEPGHVVTILSQLKVVSGMGGIGKTQTAIKYIYQFEQFYTNVIWIEAETESTVKNAFLKLADEIGVLDTNSQFPNPTKDIDIIVKNTYKTLCSGEKSTLVVFDNADDFKSGIEQFLPSTVDPDLCRLVVLVTSRNQDWKRRHEKFQVLPLNVFSIEETLNFISMQLDIPVNQEETREFIQLMGGLPLALQQSAAYINERRNIVGKSYKISDYTTEFKSAMDGMLDYDRIPGSPSTIFVTWNVTLVKILTLENGDLAIDIMEYLALLYADKIPVTLVQSLLPHVEELEILSSLALLEKYSLIKRERWATDEKFVSIHRQLQYVIIQNLKTLNTLESLYCYVREKCWDILENIDLAKSADIIINCRQLAENPFSLIPATPKFYAFMAKLAMVLMTLKSYDECYNLSTQTYNYYRETLGENDETTLNLQVFIACSLTALDRHDEALSLCQDALERMQVHLNLEDEETLNVKYEISSILANQGKYSESLILINEVFEMQKKYFGENDPSTLEAQSLLASIYSSQGDLTKALEKHADVLLRKAEILGPDHLDTLSTMHAKGTTLLRLGKVQEASDLYRHVYNKRKEILGESHPTTLYTLEGISLVVEAEKNLSEALEIRRQVLEGRKAVLGQDHPSTEDAEGEIEVLLQQIKNAALDCETSRKTRKCCRIV